MKITYHKFLKLCDEDTLAEWVDGKIVFYSPANLKHQEITLWLAEILREYVILKDLGKIIIAPFQMYLKDIGRGREPDIIFVKKENLNKLNTGYIKGGADLVVEVTSHGTEELDKKIKFNEYQQAKIKEYWIIDFKEKKAYFYTLEKGKFKKVVPKKNVYYSKVIPNFWIDTTWLFEEPLPYPQEILLKIGGEDYISFIKRLIDKVE